MTLRCIKKQKPGYETRTCNTSTSPDMACEGIKKAGGLLL